MCRVHRTVRFCVLVFVVKRSDCLCKRTHSMPAIAVATGQRLLRLSECLGNTGRRASLCILCVRNGHLFLRVCILSLFFKSVCIVYITEILKCLCAVTFCLDFWGKENTCVCVCVCVCVCGGGGGDEYTCYGYGL